MKSFAFSGRIPSFVQKLDGAVQKFRRLFNFTVKPCDLSLVQQRARMFLQRSIGYLFGKQTKRSERTGSDPLVPRLCYHGRGTIEVLRFKQIWQGHLPLSAFE